MTILCIKLYYFYLIQFISFFILFFDSFNKINEIIIYDSVCHLEFIWRSGQLDEPQRQIPSEDLAT